MRILKTPLIGELSCSLTVILLCSQISFMTAENVDLETSNYQDNDSGAISTGDHSHEFKNSKSEVCGHFPDGCLSQLDGNAGGEEENYDQVGGQDYGDDDAGDGGIAKQGDYTPPTHPSSPRPKRKKAFLPVFVPEKERKKMKILSVEKGFYVAGGTQVVGRYKSLKHCMKACAIDPTCFEGDFNPWLHKCYKHTNVTACGRQRTNRQFVHFSKVPCVVTDAPRGKVTLGASMPNGIELKDVKSLQHCIKRCVNAGRGVVASATWDGNPLHLQACFAIDYDFATHRCFVFGANMVQWSFFPLGEPFTFFNRVVWTQCNPDRNLGNAQGLRPNPTVVHITFCAAYGGRPFPF